MVQFSIYLNRRVFLLVGEAGAGYFVFLVFSLCTFCLGLFTLFLGVIGRLCSITKTCLFKYIENFATKNWKFSDNSDICHISAQNTDCGYSLEPPHRGGSNEYPQSMYLIRKKENNVYPCKPQFYYIIIGFKGVKIILLCFRDAVIFTLPEHLCHLPQWPFVMLVRPYNVYWQLTCKPLEINTPYVEMI